MNLTPLIITDPDILGGTPVFGGTTVPLTAIFESVADGLSIDAILGKYPTLTREQVVDSLRRAGEALAKKALTKRPSEALAANRAAVLEILGRYSVANPRVIGSVLHGDDDWGSDLDLLVDALPGTSLMDLEGLQLELEKLLGVPVDIVTSGSVSGNSWLAVLREAKAL